MASLAIFELWLTTRSFQANALPTSTGALGPEKDIVRPLVGSVDDRALLFTETDVWAAVGFAPATGKLWGRFERCKDWLGAPKLGFRGAERSILVLQAIDIFALHVSDKEIVASVKIDIVSAVEKPFVADIMVGRGRDGVSLFRAGRSTNKKVTISRGEHKMGNDWGVSISAVP